MEFNHDVYAKVRHIAGMDNESYEVERFLSSGLGNASTYLIRWEKEGEESYLSSICQTEMLSVVFPFLLVGC